MTDIKLELFRDITVRCVEQDGRAMIPVVDIATAIQMDRSNISKLLKRNEQYFDEYKGVVKTTTPGGEQSLVCLTRDGLMGLLFKIDAKRSKDPGVVERIIEFQHWATAILSRRTLNELDLQQPAYTLTQKPSTADVINEQLDIADIAIKRSGLSKEIAHGMAWALAANITETELNVYASYIKAQGKQLQLPEGSHTERAEYESHFSLTQISGYLKRSNDTVRNKLEDLEIIYFENGIWHLTRYGEQYGKVFMVTPGFPYSSRQRAYIKYKPEALELLRKYFDGSSKQMEMVNAK